MLVRFYLRDRKLIRDFSKLSAMCLHLALPVLEHVFFELIPLPPHSDLLVLELVNCSQSLL